MGMRGLALAAVFVAGSAAAQELPEAPHRKLDLTLYAFDATARGLDVVSTAHVLRVGGTENELPPVISNHAVTMVAFEGVVMAFEAYGARKIAEHGHPKLARLVPLIDGAACLRTDIKNFGVQREPKRMETTWEPPSVSLFALPVKRHR